MGLTNKAVAVVKRSNAKVKSIDDLQGAQYMLSSIEKHS